MTALIAEEWNRQVVAELEAGNRLEGTELHAEDQALLERYIRNELSIEEYVARVRARWTAHDSSGGAAEV